MAPRPDRTSWGQQVSSRLGHRASADLQFLAFLALRLAGSWPCNPRFCGPRPLVPQYHDCPTPPVFIPDLLPGFSRVPYLPFPSFLAPGSPVLRPVTFLFLGPLNSRIPVCGRPDPPAPASRPVSLAALQLSGCADLRGPSALRSGALSDADWFCTAYLARKGPLPFTSKEDSVQRCR